VLEVIIIDYDDPHPFILFDFPAFTGTTWQAVAQHPFPGYGSRINQLQQLIAILESSYIMRLGDFKRYSSALSLSHHQRLAGVVRRTFFAKY